MINPVTIYTGTAPIIVSAAGVISIFPSSAITAGSMSAADKIKLDAATPNEVPDTLVLRDDDGKIGPLDTTSYINAIGSISAGGTVSTSIGFIGNGSGITGITASQVGAQPVDSDLTAIAALTTTAYGRSLLTLANVTALLADIKTVDGSGSGLDADTLDGLDSTAFQVAGSYQPLDSDLTAIAALSTTAFGRSFLTLANNAAIGLVESDITNLVTDLAAKQPLDSDLTAIAALTTTAFGRSFLALADAAAARTLTGAAAATITISTTAPLTGGGDLSTNRTFAISAASGSAAGSMSAAHYILVNNATNVKTPSTIVKWDADNLLYCDGINCGIGLCSAGSLAGDGLNITGISQSGVTGLVAALAAKQPLDADLTDLAGLDGTAGYLVKTGAGVHARRTLTGTAFQVLITNGDGTTGAPVFSLPQSINTGATVQFATLGLGQAPTAVLHIQAGTTAANTAPIKLTSGSLTTAAVAGQIEFLTDKLYFTITTGAVREEIVISAGLTSGRIPFATTNGRLTDWSSFTTNGSSGVTIGNMVLGSDGSIDIQNGGVNVGAGGGTRSITYQSSDITTLKATNSVKQNINGTVITFCGTGGFNIGTVAVATSAILQADSTTKGFLPPRHTSDASSPTEGLLAANTTNHCLRYYDGTRFCSIPTTLSATATLDFGSTVAGGSTDLTITVTGAAVGDVVAIGVPNASVPAGGTFFGWVSAADTVTIRYSDNSLVTVYDPASGIFKVIVFKAG